MSVADQVIAIILGVFLVVGAYQPYFWCQRTHLTAPRQILLGIDEWIPYWPAWVWVYCPLYYPPILYTALTARSPRHFIYLAISYLGLLGFHIPFFLFLPVETPEAWRRPGARSTPSERFLTFIQRFDGRSNSFPSMHTSVAMLTALHLLSAFGAWAFMFPVLIGLSCVFTKQHYLIDVPGGAALGWAAFQVLPLAH